MKKLIFLFVFINLHLVVFNQIIKGTVYEQKTHQAIIAASVYFNGTYVGTLTDNNGNFELDVSNNKQMSLTISALGYYSVEVTNTVYLTGNPVLVYLTPKMFELKEVVINAKAIDRNRNNYMKMFKNEFLGTTDNGKMCEIINEDDITFSYESDTLKVYASKPLMINNKGLGYKMTYYLDNFAMCKKSETFSYKGNVRFDQDLATEKNQKQYFERRRKYAYRASRSNFFRALWANDIKSTGFVIRNLGYENLNYSDVVGVGDSLKKYLSYKEDIAICYYSKFPSSWITLLKDKVFFDQNGFFDAAGIYWEGQMSIQRIGDLLPYEYKLK
jgi:hypothetical protein